MSTRGSRALLALIAITTSLIIAPGGVADARPSSSAVTAAAVEWVGAGTLQNIYDPTATEVPARYINDHTFIKGRDGTWHMFGITGPVPTPPQVWPDPAQEITFAHATAPSLTGPWQTQPAALTVDRRYPNPANGEEHLWAPHVIESGGTYYMFYAAGGNGAAINLATSPDLWTWTRVPTGPLFRGRAARDPQVTRVGNGWVMYYCEFDATTHQHIVAYRTSSDLLNWSNERVAFADPSTIENSASSTESPFVIQHNGWWYLLIGPRGGYVGTDVYRMQRPIELRGGRLRRPCPRACRRGHPGWPRLVGQRRGLLPTRRVPRAAALAGQPAALAEPEQSGAGTGQGAPAPRLRAGSP